MTHNIGRRGKRILQVAHNHPRFHAGGTELTALALHREALRVGYDSWFLGALDPIQVTPNSGTQMIALSDDQREAALFAHGFRRFELAQDDSYGFLRELKEYLATIRPDVVHIHHILNFGLESLFVIRAALPESKMILSLHDYYLICPSNGQLFKHHNQQRCHGPTLVECLKCFPKRNAIDLRMRSQNIERALTLVDELVSPSFFLKEKFDKFLARKREIKVVENGYLGPPVTDLIRPIGSIGDSITFGYFGNISAIKGLADLLDAAGILKKRGITNFRLRVHGTQLFEDRKLSERIEQAREELSGQILFFGSYQSEQIAELMFGVDCLVFPSTWWENAPLVIYEALRYRRQVICYPHGGAPEILNRYGAGIFAEESNPVALANAMEQALTKGDRLHYAMKRPLPEASDLFENHRRLYFAEPVN